MSKIRANFIFGVNYFTKIVNGRIIEISKISLFRNPKPKYTWLIHILLHVCVIKAQIEAYIRYKSHHDQCSIL